MISMDLWIFISAVAASVIAGFIIGMVSTRIQKRELMKMLEYDMRSEYDYDDDYIDE